MTPAGFHASAPGTPLMTNHRNITRWLRFFDFFIVALAVWGYCPSENNPVDSGFFAFPAQYWLLPAL